MIGRAFDITDYGLCFIEDMLGEITDGTVLVRVALTLVMSVYRIAIESRNSSN